MRRVVSPLPYPPLFAAHVAAGSPSPADTHIWVTCRSTIASNAAALLPETAARESGRRRTSPGDPLLPAPFHVTDEADGVMGKVDHGHFLTAMGVGAVTGNPLATQPER